MEQHDVELIRKYASQDHQLKALYEEHLDFERQLDEFNSKPFLTPMEEMERKNLQKLKLRGRDQLESLLTRYRVEDNRN